MTGSLRDGDDDPADGGLAGTRQSTFEPRDDFGIEAPGAWPRWRRSRPFWGGLLVLLAGSEILLSERAPIPVVIHVGVQGLAGYLVPGVLLLCGLLVWFSPAQRTFYSVLAVLLSLGSWVTSNLGGFFVGMVLGVVGGSLAFAWTRVNESEPAARARPVPQEEPSAGLDLILTGLDENPPSGPPADRQRSKEPSRDEGARPVGDEPPIRIYVPDRDERQAPGEARPPDDDARAPGDKAADQKTADQKAAAPDLPAPGQIAPDQPDSGPGATRGRPAGPLGSACL